MIKKPPFLTDVVNELAINNNEASYKMMFSYLFNPLLHFSFSLFKSWELAEEVASDIMFILWQRRADLLFVNKIYAFIIARRCRPVYNACYWDK